MTHQYDQDFIRVLHEEVVPALGCTEPIAVALATARAREILGRPAESVNIYVSGNIYKNGMGVGIPGTGMRGLHIAAALGMVMGQSKNQLEVLKGGTAADLELARTLVHEQKVEIKVKDGVDKLYVESTCVCGDDQATAVIEYSHTNFIREELNAEVLLCKVPERGEDPAMAKQKARTFMSIERIVDFSLRAPVNDIRFVLEGAEMNHQIADEGLKNSYGLQVGRKLRESILKGHMQEGILTHAMALTAAASDARMAGIPMPVMSNSGSGNQGITVMNPVSAVAEKLNASEEQFIRALTIANLVAIHIKTFLGPLSALCGCVVASTGAASGITYLLGGDKEKIVYAIKNMIANITGMICDGAKPGCALKVSTGVATAVQSAFLAMDDIVVSEWDGIIDKDVEKTIRNLAEIGSKGMNETDKLMLEIMVCK